MRRRVFLLVAIMLTIGWRIAPASFNDPGIGNFILLLTGVAIVWYTLETKELVGLTRKQIDIDIQPVLTVKFAGPILQIVNVGRSPALNILVDSIVREDVTFQFEKKALCPANAGVDLGIEKILKSGTPISASGEIQNVIYQLTCSRPGDNYRLVLNYTDLEGGRWRTICRVDREGVEFERVEKA